MIRTFCDRCDKEIVHKYKGDCHFILEGFTVETRVSFIDAGGEKTKTLCADCVKEIVAQGYLARSEIPEGESNDGP